MSLSLGSTQFRPPSPHELQVRLEGLASALTPLVSELEKLAKFGVSSEVGAAMTPCRRVSACHVITSLPGLPCAVTEVSCTRLSGVKHEAF